jgi:hypothetical protein
MLSQDYRAHKTEHEAHDPDEMSERFELLSCHRPALLEHSEVFRNGLGAPQWAYSGEWFSQVPVQQRPWDDYSEKLTIAPHPIDFPVYESQDLVLHGPSRHPFAQVDYLLGNLRLDNRQQQTSLASEIAMDQPLCAPGLGRNFAGGRGLKTARSKKLAG